MTYGVYCLTNKINGKKYIGQSKNIERRWLIGNCNSSVRSVMIEFGIETFEFEILYTLGKIDKDWRETLWIHEEYFIHKFDTTNPENGYNVSTGGHCNNGRNGKTAAMFGKTHSEETKQKLRTPKSKEHKQKIRDTLKGRPRSEEAVNKNKETWRKKNEQRYREICEQRGLKLATSLEKCHENS